MAGELRSAPDPDRGWSRHTILLTQALVIPPATAGLRQKTGVLDRFGAVRPEAEMWRFDRQITLPPEPASASGHLDGRWLWAGSLYNHFGHFLVESLSRLWAYEAGAGIDGILYVPKRPRQPRSLAPFQEALLAAFGIDADVRIVREPVSCAELLVPGQGFGLGRISRGTPEMRDAARRRFGASIPAHGPERLYVSRSKTGAAGGLICEPLIETLLASEGYAVFHPQDHDIPTQIARYKAADDIIIADGSAAHLYAYVGREDQRIAYLPRRRFWTEGPLEHIASFAGARALVPDTLRQMWLPRQEKRHRGVAFALHDLAALQTTLGEAGLVAGGPPWPTISEVMAEGYLRQVAPQIAFEAT